MVESEHRLNTWQIPTVAAVKRKRTFAETTEEEETQQPNYQATTTDERSPGSQGITPAADQGIGTSYRSLARGGRSHAWLTLTETRRRCQRINGRKGSDKYSKRCRRAGISFIT